MPIDVAAEPGPPLTERLPGPPGPVNPGDLPAGADPAGPSDLLRQLHQQDPAVALQLAAAAARMPNAGEEFAGFRLLRELGRGAFGRVFLAEQTDLADRPVVLKVTLDARTEVRALARLLHTNIVPVYSVHRAGLFQAVCMPFCGTTTLADAIRRFRGETLPDSGKGLVTLLHSSAAPSRAPADPPAAPEPAPAHQPSSTVVLDLLGGLTYADAILWIAARLADGLAHAHDRGVLHRDLKPANVLLTDDGQPMLLDFNLAGDARLDGLAEAARLCGTLPYMSPEHIESFAGRKRVVDGRSDVYALGVILYELLTGRHPFPLYGRANTETLTRMVADRQEPPRLADRNPAVSPAVEAIVGKCLEADSDRRYLSAHALQEDLERQLTHLPLRHARDRDPRERLRKWARRHPRLSSALSLGTAAAVLVGLAVTATLYERDRRLGLEARETRAAFQADARRFHLALTSLSDEDDRRRLDRAVAAGREALSRYPAPDAADWEKARSVRHLPEADRGQLREEVGVALLMLAHATAKAGGPAAAAEALQLNEQAGACFPPEAVPAAVWAQRADLLDRLGRAGEAAEVRAWPVQSPTTARDLYLTGWDRACRREYAAAVPVLEEATRKDPQSLWAWFLLGGCHDGLGHDAQAVACYGTCLALSPDAHEVWFNRGLAQLRRGAFADARSDFDRAIELQPGVADAYFNRALARKALGDFRGAEDDCTKALQNGTAFTRVYFVRAQIRDRLGDKAGAAADRREGLEREPTDESCWNARGFARLGTDPAGALADFDRALDRNPTYRPALANKAHVLADRLDRPADAVAALDVAVRHYPDQPQLRASRAVYLARCGRRADAHREAEEALQRGTDPATRYQVAGVYALTSKTNPEDRAEAFRLLAGALKRDYGFEYLDTDPELAPVRQLPEFKELVAAAKALRPK
jgi:serine/threonine protein kinase/Flp pilus assembly protein TadD